MLRCTVRALSVATLFVLSANCHQRRTPDGGLDGSCDADVHFTEGGACPVRGRDESACMDLILGTGRDGTLEDFRPLTPGTPLWITPGAQGLQHVVLALRGTGFDPTNPLIEVRLVRADDCEEVGFLRFRFPFHRDPVDPSRLALEAVRVVVHDDRDPYEYCTILDRNAVLVVDFDDRSGHRAHREMLVHIAGIDPTVRPDQREAWLRPCQRTDGGIDSRDD